MRNRTHEIWIDFARGFAITGVVCIHACGAFLYNRRLQIDAVSWWILVVITAVFKVSVPLFLMLSGVVNLGNPAKNFIDGAYVRRLVRILIPFVIWSIVYMYFNLGRRLHPTDLLGMLSGNTHYHLWFIYSIIGLYTITPVLNAFVCNAGEINTRMMGVLWLTIAGGSWTLENMSQFELAPEIAKALPVYTGYYLLGSSLGSAPVSTGIRFHSSIVVVVGVVACALLTGDLNPLGVPFDNRGLHNLNPIMIAVSVAAFLLLKPKGSDQCDAREPGFGTRALAQLGRLSFGVYLSHVLVLEYAFRVLPKWILQSVPACVTMPMIALPVLLISMAFTYTVSKVPVMRRIV